MKLRSARIAIRGMRREDVDAMMRWRPSVDPLYQPFDFPRRSLAEHTAWFTDRANDPTRRLYVVEDRAGRVIGSLTLREIGSPHSARLGITLGADYVSQGYGTEALRTFLEYFFGAMGFARMDLDVASTNLRAVRCYRSQGFQEVGQHWEAAAHSSYHILVQEQRYRHLRSCFRGSVTALQILFYDMALSRGEWQDAQRVRAGDASAAAS
jgi:diamine N-acetyltransferase